MADMKENISVSLEKETIGKLDKVVTDSNGLYRNRSHVIEVAINKFLKEA